MIPARLYLLLLTGLSLFLTQHAFSQDMTNTDGVITLSNTCANSALISGTYSLNLSYVDPDNGFTQVVIPGCTVTSNGTTATITRPSGNFPAPDNNGYWALRDADNGGIALTGGPTGLLVFWYHDPNGSIRFDCVPLPIWFSSFTVTGGSFQAALNWTTDMEQNTSVIEIYRAPTNLSNAFYKIGEVPAQGNSEIQHNYSFTDPHPCTSNYYYLKMLSSVGGRAIFSNTIPFTCSGCSCTLPAPVNCPYTINGPDHICNLETITSYTLSSAVPNYSSITWSVSNPSAVKLTTYPSYDRTKATLLKKATGGGVTLSATLSGCSNVISKFITIGTPAPTISTSLNCPTLSATAGNSPGATNYEWHVVDMTTFQETITNSTSSFKSASIGGGHTWNIGFQYTNVCGVSVPAVNYGFVCQGGGGGGHKIKLSPNPSNGIVTVGLAPAPSQDITVADQMARVSGNIAPGYAGKASAAVSAPTPVGGAKIYQVQVVDAQGTVRKVFNYPGGVESVQVNLGGLMNGIYTVQVYDSKTWTSSQVVLTK